MGFSEGTIMKAPGDSYFPFGAYLVSYRNGIKKHNFCLKGGEYKEKDFFMAEFVDHFDEVRKLARYLQMSAKTIKKEEQSWPTR